MMRFGRFRAFGIGGFHWGVALFGIILIVLIAIAVVLAVSEFSRHRRAPHPMAPTGGVVAGPRGPVGASGPELILRERLARGEINEDEFRRTIAVLREAP